MSKITFDPWIGKNYGKSHFGKLLIIGDSHYFTNGLPSDLRGFTKAKIAELLKTKKFIGMVKTPADIININPFQLASEGGLLLKP